MTRARSVLKQKVLKINEAQQEMLDTFTNKWGYISEAEVLRQALTSFYRKMEPYYLQKTVNQREKEMKLENVKKIEDMTDEEYGTQVARGTVMETTDGKKVLVMHWWGNSLKAIPIGEVKETLMTLYPDAVRNHLEILTRLSVDDELKGARAYYSGPPFNLVIPGDGDENSEDA